MATMSELEDEVMCLISSRRENKLPNLWQYHEALKKLNQKVLATFFLPKSRMDYAEKMEKIMLESPNAYKPWTENEDKELLALYRGGKTVQEISQVLQRQEGGINSRLKKIALERLKKTVESWPSA